MRGYISHERGGKRKGAGRKRGPYSTKTVRVPLPVVPVVDEIIMYYKVGQSIPFSRLCDLAQELSRQQTA